MTPAEEWRLISGRVRGLVEAAKVHAQFLSVNSSDPHGTSKYLGEQCGDLLDTIRGFCTRHSDSLPYGLSASVRLFLHLAQSIVPTERTTREAGMRRVQALIVKLAALESEISFRMSDVQWVIQSRAERAFSHLQRSIVADEDIRGKWERAFAAGEPACEKLGGAHLLLHGIWAFKVDAAGERTDLVFSEPRRGSDDAMRYADGLVLTEWKLCRATDDVESRFGQARSQANRYASGSLAGNELTTYRYAVVVSNDWLEIPQDLNDRDAIYRHVNIAVNPSPPSKSI